MLDNARAFFSRWGTFLLIGAIVFVVSYVFIGRKQKATMGGTAQPLLPGQSAQPGANGQPVIEYVPTTGDSYTNINYALDSNNVANSTTQNAPGGNIGPGGTITPVPHPIPVPVPPQPTHRPPPAPVPQPPHPAPQPLPTQPPAQPRYTTYTIKYGDTLGSIAAAHHTTWPSLYQVNKGIIDQMAAAMHYIIPGGPWNNIQAGKTIQVPA